MKMWGKHRAALSVVVGSLALVLVAAAAPTAPVAGEVNFGGELRTSLAERAEDTFAELNRSDLRYEPLILLVDELEELDEPVSHGAPIPEDSIGIGPGSTLITNFYDPDDDATYTGICTAAFIFRDADTGSVYLGSAGHCFMGENFTSTHGDGADWDTSNTLRIRVCVELCLGGATGLVSAAYGLYPGATRDLGELAYARQDTDGNGVGHDFGIVEIPEDLWPEIRTDMPVWHGPNSTELRDVQPGDPVVHYGNGVGFGEVPPQKGRVGIGVTSNDNRWIINTAASPGDSGSGANIGVVGSDGIVEGEWAAGMLTHLVIGTTGGTVAGTTTRRAIEMAQEDAGFNLELVVDESELEGGGNDDPSEPLSATFDAPDQTRAGQQVAFDGSESTGAIASWHWDMGDGTVYDGDDLSSVEHAYRQPGAKNVVLTITDADGETAKATHRIRVQGPPAPSPE